jgi:UPF0755 protein
MRALKIAVLLLLLFLAAAVLVGYRGYQLVREPYKGFPEPEVFFTIGRGASAARIAESLEERGIVRDGTLFVLALRYRGETGKLQAGEYRFAEPTSTLAVLDRLVAGDVFTLAVSVPEGLTLVEAAEHLARLGLGEASAFIRSFEDAGGIRNLDPVATSLEGYLYPTTYRFPRSVEPREVARTMVAQFQAIFDERRRARAEELGLTPREVVTLASVIEKETGVATERPLIGSVFRNRLERGMPLQSDPTIIYALKLEGRFDGNLRRADLELDSPYNTYRFPGIPPGPIASPGIAALDAVLHPADTPYLYFVARNDGSHQFSTTYAEHTAAVRRYQIEYFRRSRSR